jgi:hypothetical protein
LHDARQDVTADVSDPDLDDSVGHDGKLPLF